MDDLLTVAAESRPPDGGLRCSPAIQAAAAIGCAILFWMSPGAMTVHAQGPGRQAEYNVKTAYIYGFGRYVTWPEDDRALPQDRFVIGILGESPVRKTLDELASKRTVTDRRTGRSLPIQVVQFRSLAEYAPCQILLVPDKVDRETTRAAIEQFRDRPVLLIGESPQFTQLGGSVGFLIVDGSVKFDVNIDDATRKGLKIDAKLLRAANEVVRNTNAATGTTGQRTYR